MQSRPNSLFRDVYGWLIGDRLAYFSVKRGIKKGRYSNGNEALRDLANRFGRSDQSRTPPTADLARVEEELERDSKGWYWLSFADPDLPAGSQWLGGTFEYGSMGLTTASLNGRNPGGEVRILGPISDDVIEKCCPPEARERLFTDRAELESFVGPTISGAELNRAPGNSRVYGQVD